MLLSHFFSNLKFKSFFSRVKTSTAFLFWFFTASCWSAEFKQWREISIHCCRHAFVLCTIKISCECWISSKSTKTIWNAGPRRERNKFYIYWIVNKNYWEYWPGEGNVKNCCHREGRVNTKWKLVRRPDREMGSDFRASKSTIRKLKYLMLVRLKNHPTFDAHFSFLVPF